MIRYTCDLCKRDIDPEDDVRYVVKMEITAAFDPLDEADDDDRDHLEEIQDILEQLQERDPEQVAAETHTVLRFDLCAECRKKFMKNPLGREKAKVFDFSEN